MAEVDTVQIATVDEPTLGETVATMSKALKTLGAPTDDKSTATDTTSVTHTQLLKQLSASLQALATTLPAGTNAIGKLAANSGVDIGDTDVLSTPLDDAVAGPAGITAVDSLASAAVDLAAGTTNQSVVSAPGANKQIWVFGLLLKTNGTTATVVLQDEDDTALTGTITLTDSDGYVLPPSGNFEMPWFKVATNKALEIDTGGSGTVDGHIMYAVVDVS